MHYLQKSLFGFFALSLVASVAFAEETPTATVNSTVSTAEKIREAGQDNFVELDAQAGLFTGLRLKALVYSGSSFNIGIEGLYGGSIFASPGIFPTTYGAGVRSEFYMGSGKNHAWMISPGLNGYYTPANPYRASSQPQDFGQALGQGLAAAFTDVPTRVAVLAPNVDINWLYQFGRHLGFVVGAKLGVAISVNGSNSSGEDLAGRIYPDLGLYVGTRF